ncbi:MAG: hypothetical protein AB7O80_04030 [Acetobacteraceae bacterium]
MKLQDLDRVNHLVSELADIRNLIITAQRAEPHVFQLFIEAPGDASLRISHEGASTTHSRGMSGSPEFLARLKDLAVNELIAGRDRIVAELTALGVDTEG